MTILSGSCLGSSYLHSTHTRAYAPTNSTRTFPIHSQTHANGKQYCVWVWFCFCAACVRSFVFFVWLLLLMSEARSFLTQHIYPENFLMHFWYTFSTLSFFSLVFAQAIRKGKRCVHVSRGMCGEKRTTENLKCMLYSAHRNTKLGLQMSGTISWKITRPRLFKFDAVRNAKKMTMKYGHFFCCFCFFYATRFTYVKRSTNFAACTHYNTYFNR